MDFLYRHLRDTSHNPRKLKIYAGLLFVGFLWSLVATLWPPAKAWLDHNGLLGFVEDSRPTLGLLLVFVLFFGYRALAHSVINVSVSKATLHKKYNGEAHRLLTLGHTTLNSVRLHRFAPPPPIHALTLEVQPEAFQVSWYMEQYGDDLIRRFNPSKTFNGLTLRLCGFDPHQPLHFRFQFATYYDYLITNGSHDAKLFNELTVRDILEPGQHLSPLEGALCANHLGLSALIVTQDNHLLLQLRSQSVSAFAGMLSPSVSGAANHSTFADADGGLSFENWFRTEMEEELLGVLNTADFDRIECLGLSRELIRLGKPELFFFARTFRTKEDVAQRLHRAALAKQANDAASRPDALSRNEAEKFVWVPCDLEEPFGHLLQNLRMTEAPDKAGSIQVHIDRVDYLVSESLAVNLAFLQDDKARAPATESLKEVRAT